MTGQQLTLPFLPLRVTISEYAALLDKTRRAGLGPLPDAPGGIVLVAKKGEK